MTTARAAASMEGMGSRWWERLVPGGDSVGHGPDTSHQATRRQRLFLDFVLDLPVGQRLGARGDVGNVGVFVALSGPGVFAPFLGVNPARRLLLAALQQGLFSFAFGSGGSCVASHYLGCLLAAGTKEPRGRDDGAQPCKSQGFCVRRTHPAYTITERAGPRFGIWNSRFPLGARPSFRSTKPHAWPSPLDAGSEWPLEAFEHLGGSRKSLVGELTSTSRASPREIRDISNRGTGHRS